MGEGDNAVDKLFGVIHKANHSPLWGKDPASRKAYIDEIGRTTQILEGKIRGIISAEVGQDFEVFHYGANVLHPGFLVFWIAVKSDQLRDALKSDAVLQRRLRQAIVDADYPAQGREDVQINFESQETIDRDWNGSWFEYLK
ncbi:MAG: hypothetical protein JW929_06460 [Anaerolineales bacterium]|nr:hypothetical protein [Anaerolineales bacterium]